MPVAQSLAPPESHKTIEVDMKWVELVDERERRKKAAEAARPAPSAPKAPAPKAPAPNKAPAPPKAPLRREED
jgi:hypothetical protein